MSKQIKEIKDMRGYYPHELVTSRREGESVEDYRGRRKAEKQTIHGGKTTKKFALWNETLNSDVHL